MKECQLINPLKRSFERKGYSVYPEIPILGSIIDLYCYNPSTHKTIAIEAKVKDWKKAIEQALFYRYCAEKVYIAMPKIYSHRAEKEKQLFQSYGLGLLSINKRVSKIIEAKISAHTDKILKKKILERI